jgi:hypothetical protein
MSEVPWVLALGSLLALEWEHLKEDSSELELESL